ncbi:MAG: molecular chaperone HscC [Alphaproteobacteria bacterium]|nr:molecular chaperone HscC [Alphaproteobacteria bacterium]
MIVGIDLGTTNSLVAVWQDGAARVLPNAFGHVLTPSVVGMNDNGEILVGLAARERLVTHPDRTVAAFKRFIGTDREIRLGKKKFRAEELSAMVLRSLKADAEAALGESVTEAVISVPAYFNDTQRKATQVAGELAGLKVQRLINEPTAAALTYGLGMRDADCKFLIFDLGGGTFDVSVLELFEGIVEVRASAGDNFLGGEDFVDLLAEAFLERTGYPAGITANDLAGSLENAIRSQAEALKRRLTSGDAGEMRVAWSGKELLCDIGRPDFETLSQPLLDRLRAPLERALRDARIQPADLDEVIMVGGATRMPMIRSLVARMFGRLPAGHIDPDEVVAMGAAVQAGLKARDAALDEVVLTDVCPYSLGIEVAESVSRRHVRDGYFLPVIERNTTIPASRMETVATLHDFQTNLHVKVFQGESRRVGDNIYLGTLPLKLPPGPAGRETVDIRFTYDINGLLEVQTTVKSTDETNRIVIEQNAGVLSREEIDKRLKALAKLKVHPRDESVNQAVLARAGRLYEERLGELRTEIGGQVALFEGILEGQRPEEIEFARGRLNEFLDRIEGETYL